MKTLSLLVAIGLVVPASALSSTQERQALIDGRVSAQGFLLLESRLFLHKHPIFSRQVILSFYIFDL